MLPNPPPPLPVPCVLRTQLPCRGWGRVPCFRFFLKAARMSPEVAFRETGTGFVLFMDSELE